MMRASTNEEFTCKTNLKYRLLMMVTSSAAVMAEAPPDPADLTQTNTFLWGQTGNNDYTLTGGVAGKLSQDFSYLGLIEHTRTWKRDSKNVNDNTRVRLFGVQSVDFGVISSIGASVDYIEGHKSGLDTTALGLIGKVETSIDWLALYPNIAYVSLDMDSGGIKGKSEGYQANLFASVYLGDDGKYLSIAPQYMNTQYINVKKLEVTYGAPISIDGRWWFDVKGGYTRTEAIVNTGIAKLNVIDSDKTIKIGVAYYF
ncbi:hypothetical protein PBPRB1967 [Photobacterium profundum SS9]|uniref:Uncharacterized protein n=2 Tax=Photobacterium profundum TaxID=74109 RepID=Q6LFW8_PHOPR|nr:hypothetical protein PBPRB1967 [Photobacterium profundum SS9]